MTTMIRILLLGIMIATTGAVSGTAGDFARDQFWTGVTDRQ